ncbi:MAG: DUF433 domain-containing protein [Candidatus Schekmanbacteria bacterium]|nr:DUF433 domain-containing protein [Candidatus Schekmanbacteria bacterium]
MTLKFIESKAGVCGGKPCFKKTRIPVHAILEMMGAGNSIVEIIKEYPQLKREHILEAISFAAELVNYEEISLP